MTSRWCNTSTPHLVSIPTQSIISPKSNNGQRFTCTCGRSFSTEITIRETSNVETSSPPATPMLGTRIDLKASPPLKRSKPSMIEQPTVTIIRTTTNPVAPNHLVERMHPATDLSNWQTNNLKQYENSEGQDEEENRRGSRRKMFSSSFSLQNSLPMDRPMPKVISSYPVTNRIVSRNLTMFWPMKKRPLRHRISSIPTRSGRRTFRQQRQIVCLIRSMRPNNNSNRSLR